MKKSSEIIKEFRKERHLSAAALAEQIGISQVFLTKIENEKKKVSEKVLEALKEIMPEKMYNDIVEYENFINAPEAIQKELIELRKLSSREKKHYGNFMNEATMYFTDSKISEEDKKKVLDALTEVYFEAKQMNKRKK
ncbi:MAG: helix-turn-helix domain-containing protein [Cetobacterium sp.]|uniref:helix-turn-helix domain-containing protein n=1 Tax=Cetobacterium sp. TaxID=2071632 RepID=UPI003EE69206